MIKAIETIYNGYRFRSRLEARWAVFFDALSIKYEYEKEGFELENGQRYLPDFYLPDWGVFIEIKGEAPSKKEILKMVGLSIGLDAGVNIIYGSPGIPKFVKIKKGKHIQWKLMDGHAILSIGKSLDGVRPKDLLLDINAWAYTQGGKQLDIWPYYLTPENFKGRCNGVVSTGLNEEGGLVGIDIDDRQNNKIIAKRAINPERKDVLSFMNDAISKKTLFLCPAYPYNFITKCYFGDGVFYNDKRLLAAYKKARQARFEFGETGL